MKKYLLILPVVFGVAAFGTNHILAKAENKEVVPVVESATSQSCCCSRRKD
jgi:hypothetical protein